MDFMSSSSRSSSSCKNRCQMMIMTNRKRRRRQIEAATGEIGLPGASRKFAPSSGDLHARLIVAATNQQDICDETGRYQHNSLNEMQQAQHDLTSIIRMNQQMKIGCPMNGMEEMEKMNRARRRACRKQGKTFPSSSSPIQPTKMIIILLITIISSFYYLQTTNCQRQTPSQPPEPNSPPSQPQPATDLSQQLQLQRQQQFLDNNNLGPELRADPTAPIIVNKPPGQANAFDHMVNVLRNLANQQQQQQTSQQINRRQPPLPLPLNGRGVQVGQLRPPQSSSPPPQIQMQPAQQQQVSTPISIPQFAPNQPPQIQFPPGNSNNRRITFPNQQQLPNNNNQQMQFAASSSPPTPYLQLNRISSQLQNNPNRVQQQQQQQQQFNTGNQLQPLNTIPLGSLSNQQPVSTNRAPSMGPNGLMPPPRGMRPQVQQPNFNQMPSQQYAGPQRIPMPASAPLPINYQQQQPQQANADSSAAPKPITGFAPSGPPPSMAVNSAMVVVPSPPNATGQQPASATASSQRPQQEQSSNRAPVEEKPMPAEGGTEPPSSGGPDSPSATGGGGGADDANDRDRETSPAPTTSGPNAPSAPGSSESPAVASAAAEASQPIGGSSPAPIDLDRAANDERPSNVRPDSSWNPVEANRSAANSSIEWNQQQQAKNRINLAPSPDIVTVPPGYNPDNPNHQLPQNYDISVSAQMGGTPGIPRRHQQMQPGDAAAAAAAPTNANGSNSTSPSSNILKQSTDSSIEPSSTPTIEPESPQLSSTAPPTIAPTAVTTIIWSPPPPSETTTATSSPQPTPPVPQTSGGRQQQPQPQQTELRQPTRIRDNSLLNDEPQPGAGSTEAGVVYGKPQARDSKPTPPPVNPSPVAGLAANIESSVPASGKPFIQPVQIENQVRPFPAGAQSQQQQQQQQQQQSLLKSNHHGHSGSGPPPPFRPSRPLGQQSPPMHVGSGFTITATGNQTMPIGDIQDYVAAQPPLLVPANPPAQPGGQQQQQQSSSFQVSGDQHNEPTISAHGGQDPANFDLNVAEVKQSGSDQSVLLGKAPTNGADPQVAGTVAPALAAAAPPPSPAPASSGAPPRIRRPTFKPKPAVPPIRIDSCIVDDDSSCDQSHNERCVTEYGISSCHCKPGHARLSQLRGYCNPISALQLSMKIDRLSDDRKLAFNHTLDNSNSEEYQYLEFEAIQALASAFQQTSLAKQFMGARVNKFFERKGKVWVNMSVNFDLNNITKTDKIQSLAAQELAKVTQVRQRPLGDSTIMLDGTKEAVSRLQDINECASRDLNDCSKFATCTNEFGGFQCQCMAGYEDKYHNDDRSKHGRVCLGCTASYCSNRGECSIQEGQKQCKCRPNFIGARCDYDTEVLAIAVGGSIIGVIILIITCWCLYLFNRRWKREQQKMDAMSATSGLTYNYVNSASTNSLMSPTRMIGGLHRSGGHQVGSMAANYGQRFGNAIVNGTRGGGGVMSGGGGQGGQGQQHGNYLAPDRQAIIGSTSSGSSAASQPIGCNPYTGGGGGGLYHHHHQQQQQYEDAGLLIAPASTGSSEQTSPTSNSYRGIMGGAANNTMLTAQMAAGNAYTLSGHHHHHHHAHHLHQQALNHMQQQQQQQQQQLMLTTHNVGGKAPQLTQFHPAAADYRTLNASGPMHCMAPVSGAYESRWRTLQQDKSLVGGYYLSPDMLVGQQQQVAPNMQQLYASPQRELCIDIGGGNGGNNKTSRKQQGRSGGASGGQTLRSRNGGAGHTNLVNGNNRNSLYHNNSDFHEHDRPM